MIRKSHFYLCLLFFVGCATAHRPDSEFDSPAGPELEGPFGRTSLEVEDIEGFKLAAITKFHELIDLSKAAADTTLAPSFRDAAFDAWSGHFRQTPTQDLTMIKRAMQAIALVDSQQVTITDFARSGNLYRSTVSSAQGFELEVLLLQVQKSFGDEIHLIWDTKFTYPEIVE